MKYIKVETVHQFERIKQIKKTFEHVFILKSWSGERSIYERKMENCPYCILLISDDSDDGLRLENFFYEHEEASGDDGIIWTSKLVNALNENILVSLDREYIFFIGEQTAELYSLSNPEARNITIEDANIIIEQSTIFHENMQAVYTEPEMRRIILDLKVQLKEGKGPQPMECQN